MNGPASLEQWATRLRKAAEATLGPTLGADDPIEGFRDEIGHRRAVDAPFLAWRTGRRPPKPTGAIRSADVALWWAVHDAGIDVTQWVDLRGQGPLTDQAASPTVEVWTESELGALHALWRLAELRSEPAWRDRCMSAARWHVAELQPDNATNHPWGVHVFITESLRTGRESAGSAEARLYAETLLHNCQVMLGRADRLSAHVLADAAAALVDA